MSGTGSTFHEILQRTTAIENKIRQISRLRRGNGKRSLYRARFPNHIRRDR